MLWTTAWDPDRNCRKSWCEAAADQRRMVSANEVRRAHTGSCIKYERNCVGKVLPRGNTASSAPVPIPDGQPSEVNPREEAHLSGRHSDPRLRSVRNIEHRGAPKRGNRAGRTPGPCG